MTQRLRLLLGGSIILCAALLFVALFLLLPASLFRTGDTLFQQPGTGQTADEPPAPAATLLPELLQSPLPTPVPTPGPGFKVVDIQRVESGPYLDMQGSPDGAKALLRKNARDYYLVRYAEQEPDAVIPSGITTGLAELWLLDLKSGEERLLLKSVGQYAWSPDSRQVAYIAPTAEEGIAAMLHVFDLASGESREVTPVDFLGSDYAPQWLPSGEITFVRDGEMLKVRPDAPDAVTSTGLRFGSWVGKEAGKEVYAAEPNAPEGIQFSPDGKRIAYTTNNPRQRTIAHQLWLADADGGNAQLVTEQAESGYYIWSPDSQWLVFNTFRDVDDPELDTHLPPMNGLWVVRSDGADVHLLYKVDRWRVILSPNWSTDSTLVLFATFSWPNDPEAAAIRALHLFEVETGQRVALEGAPDWIPAVMLPFGMKWLPDHQLFVTQGDDTRVPMNTYRLTLVAQ